MPWHRLLDRSKSSSCARNVLMAHIHMNREIGNYSMRYLQPFVKMKENQQKRKSLLNLRHDWQCNITMASKPFIRVQPRPQPSVKRDNGEFMCHIDCFENGNLINLIGIAFSLQRIFLSLAFLSLLFNRHFRMINEIVHFCHIQTMIALIASKCSSTSHR